MGEQLGLERGNAEVLGGGTPIAGMEAYAQRYGGHQFGNWAGQLGDGRAMTLGELQSDEGVFELQLKGAGKNALFALGRRKSSASLINSRIFVQ
jgi:uncharacterized protein YdiU (UPF0061 family)